MAQHHISPTRSMAKEKQNQYLDYGQLVRFARIAHHLGHVYTSVRPPVSLKCNCVHADTCGFQACILLTGFRFDIT